MSQSLASRCLKAQLSVASRRSKYGVDTDDIQKVFLNLARVFESSPSASPNKNRLESLMSAVESAIATRSAGELEKALRVLIDAIKTEVLGHNTETELQRFSTRQTPAEARIAQGFADALADPVRQRFPGDLEAIQKHQVSHQIRKGE
jgi:hypothetical protein